MVSKTLNCQKTQLSSSIELLPNAIEVNGTVCYLRIKKKVGENGKTGWVIRYLAPITESDNPKIVYEVKLQQRCEKLETGARLILKKIHKKYEIRDTH